MTTQRSEQERLVRYAAPTSGLTGIARAVPGVPSRPTRLPIVYFECSESAAFLPVALDGTTNQSNSLFESVNRQVRLGSKPGAEDGFV
jgi:hypothetical protein